MGRFTKRVIMGLTAALTLAAGGAFAQVSILDDFEDRNNQNKFGDYWYFFDDNKEVSSLSGVAARPNNGGKGTSVVNSAERVGDELRFTKALSIEEGGANGSNYAAKLDFKFGNSFLTAYNNTNPDNARAPAFTGDTIWYGTHKSGTGPGSGAGVEGVTGDQVALCNEIAQYKCGGFYFSPFVGIGTNLVPDGSLVGPSGIANADSLIFWAKADAALSVRVAFEQSDLGWYAYGGSQVQKQGAFFGTWVNIAAGDDFSRYAVPLTVSPCSGEQGDGGDAGCAYDGLLRQPEWATPLEQDFITTFSKAKIVKVAWQIQAAAVADATMGNDNNPAPGAAAVGWSNTFYLDDISFKGFEFKAPDMWYTSLSSRPEDAVAFDRFASVDNQNVMDGYWYFYDDTKTEVQSGPMGTSKIGLEPSQKDCASLWVDVDAGECEAKIQIDQTNGNYLTGEFTLGGNTLKIDGEDVDPFVGIGTNLYDEKTQGWHCFNAVTANAYGLYFEYNTAAWSGIEKITFEVHDTLDAAGIRPAAAVWYIDLPATEGAWRKVAIPFSALKQHTGWVSVSSWNQTHPSDVALKLTQVAKFQFKIQAGTGVEGELSLKEVYLLGQDGVSTKYAAKGAVKYAAPRASYARGVVGVSGSVAQNIASGKLSLINVKGRTVASANLVKSGNKVTANLGKGTLPTGMYFVRINAKDIKGKKIVQQVPLTVVK